MAPTVGSDRPVPRPSELRIDGWTGNRREHGMARL